MTPSSRELTLPDANSERAGDRTVALEARQQAHRARVLEIGRRIIERDRDILDELAK